MADRLQRHASRRRQPDGFGRYSSGFVFSPAKLTAVIIWGIGLVFSLCEQHAFLQSFLAYTTKDAWTFTVNTESAYDWRNRDLVGAA